MRIPLGLVALAAAVSLHAQPVAVPPPASEATVRQVDVANARITLRHGPIANLDMPAMTMTFRVRETRLLDGLRPGQRVRFDAEKVDGVYTVTRIQPLP